MADDTPDVLPPSLEALRGHVRDGWARLDAFLAPLTPAQLGGPTDAAGWTLLDHVAHLALWANGQRAVLQKQRKLPAMGVTGPYAPRDFDAINAELQQRTHAMDADAVFALLADARAAFDAQLAAMTYDDLLRPYRESVSGSTQDAPMILWVSGNTHEHVDEHLPWMQAILAGA